MRHLLVVIALLAALVAGCGDDEESSGGGGGGGEAEAQTLKVGVIPIADVAPMYLGMDKGFFEEEGLKIEPHLAEGGAAIIPAVLSGDDQIGFSNTTSLIIAASKNLPVQIISQGVLAGTGKKDAWDGVVVPKGSDIKELADLEGKTVAVNTLNNVSQIVVNTAMKEAGADYTKVKYVEVPFPDMNAALESGRVDAAFEVEPAYSGALAAGGKSLSNAYEETGRELHGRHVLHEQAVHRREPGHRRQVRARDAEVARVRVEQPRRGAHDRRRVHADPAGGDEEDEPAGLAAPTSTSRRSSRPPSSRRSTASSRRCRRSTN